MYFCGRKKGSVFRGFFLGEIVGWRVIRVLFWYLEGVLFILFFGVARVKGICGVIDFEW